LSTVTVTVTVTVTATVANDICLVTLNRPEALNAFSTEMMDDLCEAFLAAAADPKTKVLVLTGAGRAFSSGADLKSMGTQGAPPKHGLKGLLETIIDFPKPFLIAANGLGVGIGCTILGLADVAFAGSSAKFKCPFSALGLTAEAASTITFPNLMGHQQASWTLLSSEWLSAERAQAAGLVLSVFQMKTYDRRDGTCRDAGCATFGLAHSDESTAHADAKRRAQSGGSRRKCSLGSARGWRG